MNEAELRIAVMPGDGIGVEVMTAALEVLAAVQGRVGGFKLANTHLEAGAGCYQRTGVDLSDEVYLRAEAADAVLFGAIGLPDVRLPDGREIASQLDLRERMDLFAGVRPIRLLPGVRSLLAHPRAAEIDLVILREQTEGLFAERGKPPISDDLAEDVMRITRKGSERLFDFAFDLARRRKARGGKGRVDCIDKANVLGSMAYFRKIFYQRAAAHPDVTADVRYIDATALDLVRKPWEFDVMPTENMFGDIISDLAAGLIGGMGMAPSADIGARHALFQPSHGTAPDITGKGIANPTAMILSAGMMLDWLGETKGVEACTTAGRIIEAAVDAAFAGGSMRPHDLGGQDGTGAITRAIVEAVRTVKA